MKGLSKSNKGGEVRVKKGNGSSLQGIAKTVSEKQTAINEQREIQISVRPLASNDSQYRIGGNSK